MGVDLSNLPPAFRENILRNNPAEMARLGIQKAGIPAALRQIASEEALNKTERAYLLWLRTLKDTRIWVQCFGLRLSGIGGDRVFFYPDFAALDKDGLRFIDTKAVWIDGKVHVSDDARVKMAWAAQVYAPLPFLVAWQAGGIWHHKRVSPGSKL